jgi:MFS family permease
LTVVLCGALGEAVTGGAAHAHGVPTRFFVVVALYLVYGIALGTMGPVKQGYLNAHIPSEQRATIISLDALFADAGGVAGQSGWGYLAKMRSIGEAWIYAGVTLLVDVPMYFIARKNDKELDKF